MILVRIAGSTFTTILYSTLFLKVTLNLQCFNIIMHKFQKGCSENSENLIVFNRGQHSPKNIRSSLTLNRTALWHFLKWCFPALEEKSVRIGPNVLVNMKELIFHRWFRHILSYALHYVLVLFFIPHLLK